MLVAQSGNICVWIVFRTLHAKCYSKDINTHVNQSGVFSDARFIVGVDEAGRGPLAGPVSVGVVAIAVHDLSRIEAELRDVKDSKKLSRQKREGWRARAHALRSAGVMNHTVSLVGVSYINKYGITRAVRAGIERSLARLRVPQEESLILLDGGLRAPRAYKMQQTIVRGDDKEPLIALASILAKVRRDTYMTNLGSKMPQYGFDQHKGYGTAEHMKSIRMHGISPVHRTAFVHI